MLKNYIKTAVRNIKRQKAYSFINISGLAIGMACCLLIFFWIDYEWSYNRHHENFESIHRIVMSYPRGDDTRWNWRTPPPLAEALKADIPEIQDASRFYTVPGILVEQGQTRFKESIGFTDSELFPIFGLHLRLGITDGILSDPHSLIISATAAEKYFGNQNPIGKSMVIGDSLSFQVVAVMDDIPRNSIIHSHFLVPFQHLETITGYGNVEDWGDFGFNTFVLLANNSAPHAINKKLFDYLDRKWEQPENDVVLSLQSLTRIHLYALGGGGPIIYIWIFSIIAIFILLIACINFMNLSTARSFTRAREIGIRKVTGADRWKVIQQFYGESILLSVISLFFSLIIVFLAARPLADLAGIPPSDLRLHAGMIPVVLVITLITGIVAGSYPALFLSSFRPIEVLKGRMRSNSSLFRKLLVVFQFSISVILLISLMLITHQINYMNSKPLGFAKDHVVYVPLNRELVQSLEAMQHELLQSPLVMNASAVSNYLGSGPQWSTSGVRWEGHDPQEGFSLQMIYCDQNFADTFNLEIKQGRFFSREHLSDSQNFVLNEIAVHDMGVSDPLGMELTVAGQKGRLIGILKNFHHVPLRDPVRPLVLVMEPQYFRYLAVRIAAGDIKSTLSHIEKVFKKLSPKYPFEYRFLDEVIGDLYRAEQRSQKLLRYFVVLAGAISCLGLFGLASFMAESRTKEIGVRKVLGASEAGIFAMLSKNFILWVLAANLIAWPIAYFGMSKWLQDFTYRAPMGWHAFILAGIISLSLTMLTISRQVLKIAHSNPVNALKYE